MRAHIASSRRSSSGSRQSSARHPGRGIGSFFPFSISCERLAGGVFVSLRQLPEPSHVVLGSAKFHVNYMRYPINGVILLASYGSIFFSPFGC